MHPSRPADRNQCSASSRTLNHHKCFGKGHQPKIPCRGVPLMNTTARPGWTHQQPLPADLLLQRAVVGWINTVQRCLQHRNRCTISGQTAAMGCSINPSASELRMGHPASARARPSPSAIARPWSEAERVPTTEIAVRAFKCGSSDRSPSTYSPSGGGLGHSSNRARQGHPAKGQKQEHQGPAQSRARANNAQRLANRSTAKQASGQGVPSTNPRSDRVRWLDRGKACTDPPCVSCPSPGNRSRATAPAQALSEYVCTREASGLHGSLQRSWLTS